MLDNELFEEGGDGVGAVSRAVVTHELAHFDAQGGEVGQGLAQELDDAADFFVGHDFGVGDAGGVIDGHMDELPACARDMIAFVAGDAVAGTDNATELFNVDMQQVAGMFALVANGWRRRVQIRDLSQAVAGKNARDRSPRQAAILGDLKARQTHPAQGQDHGDRCPRGCLGMAMRSAGAIP